MIVRRFLRIAGPLAVLGAALAVVSCSGGGGATVVDSSPINVPTIVPTPVGISTTLPTTSGSSVTVPAVAGLSTIFTFGAGAPASTTINLQAQVTAPTIAPLPSALTRQTQSIANATPFLYVAVTVSQTTVASAFAMETILLNGQPTGVPYAVEIDDTTTAPGTKVAVFAGAIANSTVQFANGFVSGTTFQAGHTYLFQFYYVASASPSPGASATATSSASASPTSTVTTAPTSATQNFAVGTGVLASFGLPSVSGISGVLQYGGFSSGTTVTLTSTAGVPAGVAAPPSVSSVFLSVGITASPAVTMSGAGCTSSCTSQTPVVLTLPASIASSAPYFKVYECNATACPMPNDSATLPLTNGNTLTVPSSTFADITGFSTTATTLMFLTSATP